MLFKIWLVFLDLSNCGINLQHGVKVAKPCDQNICSIHSKILSRKCSINLGSKNLRTGSMLLLQELVDTPPPPYCSLQPFPAREYSSSLVETVHPCSCAQV